jgi:V/A-type H+-transporting ATPase subunit I
MLLPLKMKKAIVGVHNSYLDEVIAALHEAGIMEIRNIWDSESEVAGILTETDRSPNYDRCIENIRRIDGILDALPRMDATGQPALGRILFPQLPQRVPVKKRSFRELCREIESVVPQAGEAQTLQREIARVDDRSAGLRVQRSSVEHLSVLNPDLATMGESAFLYSVPVLIDASDAVAIDRIQRHLPDDAFHLETSHAGDRRAAVITTLRGYREELDGLLKESGIRILALPGSGGRPAEVTGALDAEIDALEHRRRVLNAELEDLGKRFTLPLLRLQEELDIEKERMLSRMNFGRTQNAVFIEGWVAEKDTRTLQTLTSEAASGHAFCRFNEPADDEADVPIEYDNPSWLRPFEMITTMFSRPRYAEIDPTFFTAPLLILFFALMLGDAVYGMIIVLLGLLLYAGWGRVSSSLRNAGVILTVAGIVTVISGVLQGGYMGDFLPRFLGVTPPFVVINALESPVAFLRIALVIGILQINLGLILAAYQNYRTGQFRTLVHEQIAWFLIQPAAAVLIFSLFGWAVYPTALLAVVSVVGGTGILLVLTRHGALGFFNLTGFLGDWLSYARLLALALATGGIAMTVNILAQMVAGDHPLSILLAVLIFIIGQTFNFVLQTLGAFIHSLRLQFVEFFGKFYVGGGKAFSPFSARRDVTVLVGGEPQG